jgi:capsular polysaccharide biosynthesis protein/Mrp family chromosome partitioning ATPase
VAAFNRAFGDPAGERDDEGQIDVARIARVLAANARTIALVVAVITAIVLVLSLSASSRYRATARIVADTSTTASTSADSDSRRLATNVALLRTPDVLADAARRLPGETATSLRGKVTTSVATDADVIDVTATDSTADAAAADANAVARAFLERRTANERASILRTRAALTAQLAGVGKGPSASAAAAAIRTRLSELVVDEANAGSELQLAEPAEAPAGPYAPRPLRNSLIAFFAAFLVAALAVLLRDRVRPEARGPRDVERASGVPLIAMLPGGAPPARMNDRLDAVWRRLDAATRGGPQPVRRPLQRMADRRERARATRIARARAATGDGLRSLLGTTLLALPPGDRHVILVTSAARGQGSARVAAGLARALAQAGQDTLAMSTDPSSSELAAAFGVPSAPGLAEALERARDGATVRLRTASVADLETLRVLPAGSASHNGVGLVRPGAVDALFIALNNTGYGYVVVEAPALLTAPEAWLVARNADAAIVACPELPSAEELAEARRALERLDVRVLGAVRTAYEPVADTLAKAPPAALVTMPGVPDALDEAAANGGAASATEARHMLESLHAADRPLTFTQLRDALGDPPAARVRARLRQLVEDGDVVRHGSGRRGDPYLYGLSDE